MAMRLDLMGDKSNLADIINLIDVVELQTSADVLDFAVSFYPEAHISTRPRLGIRALWRVKDNPAQEGHYAAPAYLGRGRPSP